MTQQASPEVTSDDKLWGMLAYILSPLVPLIIMFMEDKKSRPFLKAHYMQALIYGIVGYVVSSILSPVVGIGCIVWVAYIVMAIIWGLKANKGEYVEIPVITNWCKSQGWA